MKSLSGKLAVAFAATGLACGPAFADGSTEALDSTAQLEELETVLVSGERPGPGLWKVSKGDHVMWVLASYEHLPKGMTWRSKEVEARIAESRELLLAGTVVMDLDVGAMKLLTSIPSIIRTLRIPDGKTLQDVLPPATYEKWRPLREKYVRRSVEKQRPALAMDDLREAAYRDNGLKGGPDVEGIVKAAAKKHRVPVRKLRDAQRTVRIPELKGLLKTMQKVELPDIECFTRSLDKVESDLAYMKVLANAWAIGNVEALRGLEQVPEFGSECDNVLEIATEMVDAGNSAQIARMNADWDWHEEQAGVQARREWVAAASRALARNASTFAVLPVREVIGSRGYLAELQNLGYAVEEPSR